MNSCSGTGSAAVISNCYQLAWILAVSRVANEDFILETVFIYVTDSFYTKANSNNNNNFLSNLSANYCIPGNVILILIKLNSKFGYLKTPIISFLLRTQQF